MCGGEGSLVGRRCCSPGRWMPDTWQAMTGATSVSDKETTRLTQPEVKLPQEVAHAIQTNTRQYLASVFGADPATGQPVKRPGAASIVIVLERSGAVAAAGITDYFQRHQIQDPRLIVLSYLGHELEQFCGYILHPHVPQDTEQAEIDEFKSILRALVHKQTHPITTQVTCLANLIAQLPDGDHEIQVIDDYMARGGVNEVIMPTVVELAALQAGLPAAQLRVRHPRLNRSFNNT